MEKFYKFITDLVKILKPKHKNWVVSALIISALGMLAQPWWIPYLNIFLEATIEKSTGFEITGWILLVIGIVIHFINRYEENVSEKNYNNNTIEGTSYSKKQIFATQKPDSLTDLIEIYMNRVEYLDIENHILEQIIRLSLEKDFPLLFWCRLKRNEVVEILHIMTNDRYCDVHEKAIKLYYYLTDNNPLDFESTMGRVFDGLLVPIGYKYDMFDKNIIDKLQPIDVISYLAEYGNKIAFDQLVVRFIEGDKYIRRAIAYSLCNFRIFPAIDLLVEMLDDPDFGVQGEALRSLGEMSSDGFFTWIFYLLENENSKRDEHHKIRSPYHKGDSLTEFVHEESSYSRIFPEGISNKNYLKTIICRFKQNDNYQREKVILRGLIGNEFDLNQLLKHSSLFIESTDKDIFTSFIRSINILDERLYYKETYQKIFKDSPICHRWWQKGGYFSHDIMSVGMSYLKNGTQAVASTDH